MRGSGLQVAIEPELPQLRSVLRYGDYAGLLSSAQDAGSRWGQTLLVARADGIAVGVLLISHGPLESFAQHVVVGHVVKPLLELRAQESISLIGNIARHYGGAIVTEHRSQLDAEDVLLALVREAYDITSDGRIAIAVNVPHDQVPAFQQAGFIVQCEERKVWYELEVPKVTDEQLFLRMLDATTRRMWRQDFALREELDVTILCQAYRSEMASRVAGLIAEVRARNGEITHPVLVEYELRRWVESDQIRVIAFCAYRGDGELVGVALAKAYGSHIDLYDVGLIDQEQRGEVYRALVFAEPVRYALQERVGRIVLGTGHNEPKRMRGARGTLLHTLTTIEAGIKKGVPA